jgi:hypothetical protein
MYPPSPYNLYLNRGSQWTPAQLANKLLWLDAKDASTITVDGSNRVSAWADKSGGAKNATQATGSAQPLYEATGFNSRPCVYFDGAATQRFMATPAIASQTSLTIYIVHDHVTTTAVHAVLDIGTYANAGSVMVYRTSANRNQCIFRQTGDTLKYFSEATGAAMREAWVLDLTIAGAGAIVAGYKDNASQSLTTSSSASVAGATANAAWKIGTSTAFAYNCDARIAEILVCSGQHDAATRLLVDNYFKARWGLS